MKVDITLAKRSEKRVIQNLAQYYVYDMAEFAGWDCLENGLYLRDPFGEYWLEPHHFPFLIRVDGQLAGFVLIKRVEDFGEPTWHVGEFFVLRNYRRKGVGQRVAHTLFDRFRGNWSVMQIPANTPAIAFWRETIGRYTGGDYREKLEYVDRLGVEMIVQRFTSQGEGRPS